MMTLEKFVNPVNETLNERRKSISIRRDGTFSIPRQLMHYVTGEYVVLYYDRQNQIIGMEFVKEPTEGALKLTTSVARLTPQISGRAFFNYYDIKYRELSHHRTEWSEEQKKLIFLKEPI